jgi:uncharacterized protein YfaP (DUF2135 family)
MRKIIQEAVSTFSGRLRRNDWSSSRLGQFFIKAQDNIVLRYLLLAVLVGGILGYMANIQTHHLASAMRVPALVVKNGDDTKEALKLSKLKVNVDIVGNVVTTTMDMTFHNPQYRIREGELNFPLENEQVVSRFAMELNGKLREGVVVEKEKGRRTFETIVRKGVDPALLEMTKGNNFKARVYPIPMNGYKRIVIGYEEELDADSKAWWYKMAMGFEEQVDTFEMDIQVAEHANLPIIEAANLENLTFQKKKNKHLASYKAIKVIPAKNLKVKIPLTKENKPIVLTNSEKGETYFYINHLVTPIVKKQPLPKRITLVWDVSNSAKKRKINKELGLLYRLIKKIKNLEIELVTFSNAVHSEQVFQIKNGNWKPLKKAIEDLEYDGGTQLGALDLSKYKSDKIILSTDGLTTFGQSKLKLPLTPIIVFNSNTSSDDGYLKYISAATGGKYLDFNHQNKYELESGVLNTPYQFISATFDHQLISKTYPNIKTPVEQEFSMAGILKGKSATITLNYGIGNNIMHSETIEIQQSKNENHNVQRLWAKKAVNQLMMQSKKNEKAITKMGKQFSLVTPYTSLIVLERVEDYVEYEIEPPAELLDEYAKLMAEKKRLEAEHEIAKYDGLKNELVSLRNWWKTGVYKKYSSSNSNSDNASVVATETDSASVQDGSITFSASDVNQLEYSINGNAASQRSNAFGDIQPGTYNVDVQSNSNAQSGEVTHFGESDASSPPPPPVIEEVPDEQIDEDLLVMEDIDDIEMEIPRTMPPPNPPHTENGDADVLPSASDAVNKDAKIELEKAKEENQYIVKLKKANSKNQYSTYLELKNKKKRNATFYLEVASFFLEEGKKVEAIRILSNIAEMQLENRELLKIAANKLRQIKEYDLAILIFKEITKIRSEEPQAFRDLALAHLEKGNYQEALDLLYKVISENWEENEERFTGIKTIALIEMNNIIALHRKHLNLSAIPKHLIQNYPMDIRIVLNWTSDNVDVDLWVTDPNGEKCYYSNNRTKLGGRISNDMTRGYGPEEFLLKNAITGKYKIEADFFGDTRQGINGNVTVDAQLFTNYGRPNQQMKEITLTLSGVKEVVQVGNLEF